MKKIILSSINAKWIHPSLALRLLKANLGSLEDSCEIIEFNLRQPLAEKIETLLSASAHILGISVSIWNNAATVELLRELHKMWNSTGQRPVVALGGPEISHLQPDAEIFRYADYVIRGEGEDAFRELCANILTNGPQYKQLSAILPQFINAENVDVNKIKSGYHLYTDEDVTKKLIYVEASRGCPFNCEFCLSAVKEQGGALREFPIEPFLAEMDILIRRGVKTFKFLDRTFNVNIKRALRIMEFFLEKIEERKEKQNSLVVHFEMVPSLFPAELRETLTRFPPGTLRLEIGIQTLNSEVAYRIKRLSEEQSFSPEKELETLRFLRQQTAAIIHADLIAGLPGEDLASFGKGFDNLWLALSEEKPYTVTKGLRSEIQLGILKLLPGAPIQKHNDAFRMRYNSAPPYEVLETSVMSEDDLKRVKNFARFWEIIINRSLSSDYIKKLSGKPIFQKFITLSDSLYSRFGRNWGIDRYEMLKAIENYEFV
ncbi:MAG: radical SAM protein [Treponema sp.]|nr:radical SAM protein [Treponema sp.]